MLHPGRVGWPRRPDPLPTLVRIRAAQASQIRRCGAAGEGMLAGIQDLLTIRVHRIFIRATPEEIWDALTRPGWTQKYGYRAAVQYDLRPGGLYLAFATGAARLREPRDVLMDGEVVIAEPPWRLVQTWHAAFDAAATAEPETRLSWQIGEDDAGYAR